MQKIETALLTFYGPVVPFEDIAAQQLHATLSKKNVSTRHILELATFWGISLSDLLTAPAHFTDYKADIREMFAGGTSMNTIARLYGIDAKTVSRWVK